MVNLEELHPTIYQAVASIALFAIQMSGEVDPTSMYGYFLNLISRSHCEPYILIYASCLAYNVFSVCKERFDALNVRRIFLVALSLSYNLLSDAAAEISAWTEVVDDALTEADLADLQYKVLAAIDWNAHLLFSDVYSTWVYIREGFVHGRPAYVPTTTAQPAHLE